MFIVFFAYACMASAFVTNKMLLSYLSPSLLVGLRMLAAGLALIFFNSNSKRFTWGYIKKDLFHLTSIVLFTTSIPSVLKAYALKHMLTFKVSLIWSFDPFITAFYAYLIWHERLNWNKVLGISIAFLGVLGTLIAQSPGEDALMISTVISYPEIAAIIAMMLGRLGWMTVQYLLRKERYTPVEVNGITMTASGVLTLTWVFFINPFIDACFFSNSPSLALFWQQICELVSTSFTQIRALSDWKAFGLLVYTIWIGNFIGYTMYARALKSYSATLVSLAGFSYPIIAAILAYFALGESITWQFALAAIVIFIGLLVFNFDQLTVKKSKKVVEGGGGL
ncbi:MAG: DMT family transporter [Candidatus Babeliales bacterium]